MRVDVAASDASMWARVTCDARILGRDQAHANRVPHEARGVANLELVHHAAAMRLRGLHADPEHAADLLRRFPLGDELEHLALARRERARRQLLAGPERL